MPPKRPYHHGDLRRSLLDATRQLIAERGAEGVSLREVARRAGVSVAAPYRHFPDKAALMDGVAEEGFRRLHTALNSAIRDSGANASARKRLEQAAVAYVQFALEAPALFDAMFQNGMPAPVGSQLDIAGCRAFAIVANGVIACQAERSVRSGDPLDIALAAWSMMHGLAMLLRAQRVTASRDPRDIVARVGPLLFEGIGAQAVIDDEQNHRETAVLAIITRRDGRTLMIRRALHIPGAGYWVPPGGKPESGESLTDAVVREVREETGLEVTAGAEVHRCPTADGRYELVWFEGHLVSEVDSALTLRPEEVADAGWFDAQELTTLEPMYPATRLFFAARWT